ncbi:FlgN protein [Fodinibius roseus]|uniref:FlgN protein n=1 Tax=Fodinibius roseus TaxID=1194090 RepID=A0A1M5HD50_9BACT|nr:flagellar export chaperone FlgN [Fodinibius roseus]SHG13864.1 FlgN protein [Fodinibius roseus]
MQSENEINESFRQIEQKVESLQGLARQMKETLDKQTEAIISADEEKLTIYTEAYTDLKGRYNQQEQKFIDQLHHLLEPAGVSSHEVRLEQLKGIFPNASSTIDKWKEQLRRQARELKRKNERVVELLDFALNRNAELMYAIYSLNNRKSTHYGSGGQKEEISSGMTVNKEA